MTYDEFKEYLVNHLWKTGDSVVFNALDSIILTAEAELNRTFKVEDRSVVAALSATSPIIPLPADFRELRHLYSPSKGEMKYSIPAAFANKIACNAWNSNDFTVVNKTIRLPYSTMSVGQPEPFDCLYYSKLVPFSVYGPAHAEENWIVNDYFDVYLYCVLKHTAPFLREDERIQTWDKFFTDAFGSAMNENDERKFAGSPLKIKFSRNIR